MAYAASPATTSFNVTITIQKECTVTKPNDISLGTYGAVQAQTGTIASTTTFSVTCSKATPYSISFVGTTDVAGTPTTHQMKGAIGTNTDLLQYNLFDVTSGTASAALGGTAPAAMINDTGTGTTQSKTLQGKLINPTGAVTADVYTDIVTMAVTY